MLNRFALLAAVTAAFAIPSTNALAGPQPNSDGVLPEEACHATYPAHTQPFLCGRGTGGPEAE
jgi:hypothetical protein